MWPEAYFFAGEEWELSKRFKDRGYRLVISGELVVLHKACLTGGQGLSHDFDDLRFVLNSYLNRVLFSYRNYGVLQASLFRLGLAVYLMLVLPFRWATVGQARTFRAKVKISARLLRKVMFRSGKLPITLGELNRFRDGLEH